MYVLMTVRGDRIGSYAGPLADAISWARKRLKDDPEAGALELYEIVLEEWRHRRTITFGPGADWQSIVVVLEPGEKVEAPGSLPPAVGENAYEITDPKHPRHHDVMAEVWDNREKVQ